MLKVPPLEFAKTWESLGRNVLKLLNKIAFQFFFKQSCGVIQEDVLKVCFSLEFCFVVFFFNFEIFHWVAETQQSISLCFVVTTAKPFCQIKKKSIVLVHFLSAKVALWKNWPAEMPLSFPSCGKTCTVDWGYTHIQHQESCNSARYIQFLNIKKIPWN